MENLSREELIKCEGGSVALIALARKALTLISTIVNFVKKYGRLL